MQHPFSGRPYVGRPPAACRVSTVIVAMRTFSDGGLKGSNGVPRVIAMITVITMKSDSTNTIVSLSSTA
eukprot:scaffold113856_cov35-Cyclotella_meneghiniana.AAC.1